MRELLRPRRLLLLAAALLAGCAAGGAEGTDRPAVREGRFQPSGAFGAYLAGRFASSETDTRAAADNLLQALRSEPNEAEVLSRAFVAAVLDGRGDALRLARRLPDNQIAVLVTLGADAQAGRWERAEQRARALPRQGAVGLLQPLLLAWAQAGRGQHDAALATLRPLTEAGRLRGLASLHSALIADLAGRPQEAVRFARAALAESPTPNFRLLQASAGILARNGREAEAARLLDSIGRSSDDLALAVVPSLRRAMLNGRAVSSPLEGIAEAELALAAALRGQGAADLAHVLARLSLRIRPGFAPALLLAAEALADERHYASALAMLEQVPTGDPLAPVASLRRAVLLDRLDRTDEAAALLRELAAANPASPQPMARLGDILRGRSRFAEAVVAYDAALARVPNPEPGDWALFYARGIANERAGNWPVAEADFQRALLLSPEQPYVLNYLGYTWVENGVNLVEARRMLERAAALRPQDGNIADSLGWALFRLNDVPGAIRWLEKAVELEPRNSVINDHLGDAYWAAGRRAEAQFQWRRALSLDPEPGEAPKIEAKLRDGLPGVPSATAQR
jgi:tetratricopeptide (TPR) repeat protein